MPEAHPSPERVLAVYRAIRQRWGRWYGGPLTIAPGLSLGPENAALLRQAGYLCRKPKGWWSGRIDLSQPLDALKASFAATFRNRLKKSLNGALTLRVSSAIETVDWIIARHIEDRLGSGQRLSRRYLDPAADRGAHAARPLLR